MSDLDTRPLDAGVAVTGQVRPEQVADLARRGVRLLVNNRPDGESPDQPSGVVVQEAARAAGVDYLAAPVRGLPDADTVGTVRAALESCGGDAVMFCRSGMRSATVWALIEAERGRLSADDIRQRARDAGYDLSSLPI